MLYVVPLGPGAAPALAFFTTCCTSFNCGSQSFKGFVGSDGVMRISHCPKSTSLLGSLYVVLRYSSKCSLEHISFPLFFWPSSCFVNWNGLAINAGLFCALSLLRLRWYSVKSIALNSSNGPLSSSLAFLCCFLRTFSSCRMLY